MDMKNYKAVNYKAEIKAKNDEAIINNEHPNSSSFIVHNSYLRNSSSFIVHSSYSKRASYLKKFIVYSLYFIVLNSAHSYGQSLDQLGFKKGVTLNGSINASTTAYTAHGIDARRDPFAWYLNGNLNINLFGYSVPFSFSYSNQRMAYTQPFNQFRFAPSYKWAKAYFGSTSMTFSNYTLAGHLFNGVGVELTPGKWRAAAMYGTLLKAVPFDVANPESYNRAAFERKGYGMKLGYEDKGNSYGIAIFRAKDDKNSLPFIPADATITPMENIAIAATVKQNITKRIFAETEYSISSLNRDVRSLSGGDSAKASFGLQNTSSTRNFDAIQAGLGYRGDFYTIQLRYERVAPDYTTLGAYNVVNDMRNITIAPTVQLFKGKVNIAANAGMQKNNLDESKTSSTKRWVGTLNVNVVPNEHWAVNGGYSNFSNYTRIRPQVDPYFNNPLDTLDFYQVNNSYNGMVMYRTGDKNKQHTISLNSSYQYASDKSSAQDAVANLSKFFTGIISYSYNLQPKSLSVTGSLNYYKNNATGLNTSFVGPTVNVTKQYLEKTLRAGVTATYNATKATSQVAGNPATSTNSSLFNTSLNVNYSPKGKGGSSGAVTAGSGDKKKLINPGKHNIGGSLMYLNRGASGKQEGYSELTFTMNYTYSF